MDIPAQCSTTAGRGKDPIKGGKGEVGFTGIVTIVTVEQSMVKGVSEREGHPIPCDIGLTTGAVGVVIRRRLEAIRVRGSESVVDVVTHYFRASSG